LFKSEKENERWRIEKRDNTGEMEKKNGKRDVGEIEREMIKREYAQSQVKLSNN
jgi:hypothetical protein